MIYRERGHKEQLSTGVMFAEAQVQSSVFYFQWKLLVITWIIKGFEVAFIIIILTVKTQTATPRATFESVLLIAALKGICGISYS